MSKRIHPTPDASSHDRVSSESLREEGRRMTLQRRIILDVLEAERGHLAADNIYQRVIDRFPQISRATVYRTLDTMEQLGLVSHTHAGPAGALYHLSDKPPHLHLLCSGCGKVEEASGIVAAGRLIAELKDAHGFQADPSHFVIGGWCRACAASGHGGLSDHSH